jgi:1,4-dihydroxy-2-naphthoate octaprenyltransferase
MTSETLQADPAPAEFAGEGPARTAKRLFNATRPKFFPASVLPVLAGSAWGFRLAGQLDWLSFLLALAATVCVHAGANVLNDVGDEEGGTDRQNGDRIYPYTGGSRFIQTGIMSKRGMLRLGIGLLAVAAAAGVWLLVREGVGILWFGLAGLLLAVAYSLGPVRLSALGLGEATVGVAFGVLPVTGAAWLQSGVIDSQMVLYSLPVALWVAGILLINGVPDIAADGATGKRTLPVRLGLGGTAVLYAAMNVAAVAVVIWLTASGALPLAAPLVPIALLALAAKAAAAIRRGIDDRPAMTSAIEATLGIHTIGSVWLTGAVLYAAFAG